MSDQVIGLPRVATSSETGCADFRQGSGQVQHLSDESLLEELKKRNHEALSILFKRYHGMVFRVCRKILRDRNEAEDVLQDVFMEIYRVVEKFNPAKGSGKAWILQYAYHRSLDRKRYLELRRKYHRPQIFHLDALESWHCPSGSNGLTTEEFACTVQEWLEALSREQRETLKLACFQGLSLPQIAKQSGKSLMSVQNNYYRGLKKLRAFLKDHMES